LLASFPFLLILLLIVCKILAGKREE
jgi:hypothetical protein